MCALLRGRLGRNHWYTANSLVNLGRLKKEQQEYEEAQQYLEDALSIYEQTEEDANMPEIRNTLVNLKEVYEKLGMEEKMRECQRKLDKIILPAKPPCSRYDEEGWLKAKTWAEQNGGFVVQHGKLRTIFAACAGAVRGLCRKAVEIGVRTVPASERGTWWYWSI